MKLSCVLPGHLATILVKIPEKSSNVYHEFGPSIYDLYVLSTLKI